MTEELLDVSEQDSKGAMSVGFQWFERSIGTLVKSVRSRNTRQTKEDKQEASMAIQSAPNLRINRRKSASAGERIRTETRRRPNNRRSNSTKSSAPPNAVAGPSSQPKPAPRRGSITHLLPSPHPSNSSASATPTPSRSTTPNSYDYTRANGYHDTALHHNSPYKNDRNRFKPPSQTTGQQNLRPRNRFSFQSLKSLKNWLPTGRSSASSTNSPSPIEPSTPSSMSFIPQYLGSASFPARSVPDVLKTATDDGFPILRGRESCRNLRGSSRLTSGLRASSWGDFVDYPRQSEDVMSIHSAEDDLDDGARRFGAGGVGYGPALPVNGGLMATHSSIASDRTSSGGDLHAASISSGAATVSAIPLTIRETEDPPSHQDPAGAHGRQILHPRVHTTSPLNQAESYTYDSDDSSVFNRGYCGDAQPSTTRIYDEDGSDESDVSDPIEVRRRRASVAASAASPPQGSETGHSEDEEYV